MQNSLWKLAALAGVVGIGFLAVLQAQRGLNRPAGDETEQTALANPADAAGDSADANDRRAAPAADDPFATEPRTAMNGGSTAGQSDAEAGRFPAADDRTAPSENPFDAAPTPTSRAGRSLDTASADDRNAADDNQPVPSRSRSRTKPRGLDFNDQDVASSEASAGPTPIPADDPFGSERPGSGRDRKDAAMPAGLETQDAAGVSPAGHSDAAKSAVEPTPDFGPERPAKDSDPDANDPGPKLVVPASAGELPAAGDDLPSQPRPRPVPEPRGGSARGEDPRPSDRRDPAGSDDELGNRKSAKDPSPRDTPLPIPEPRRFDESPAAGDKTALPGAPARLDRSSRTDNPFGDVEPRDPSDSPSPRERRGGSLDLDPRPRAIEPREAESGLKDPSERKRDREPAIEPTSSDTKSELLPSRDESRPRSSGLSDMPLDGSFPGSPKPRGRDLDKPLDSPASPRFDSRRSEPTPALEPESDKRPSLTSPDSSGPAPRSVPGLNHDADPGPSRDPLSRDRLDPLPRSDRPSRTLEQPKNDPKPSVGRLNDSPLDDRPRGYRRSDDSLRDDPAPGSSDPAPRSSRPDASRPDASRPDTSRTDTNGDAPPARNLDPLPRSDSAGPRRERPAPLRDDLVGDGTIDPATPKGPQRPQLKIEKLAPQNAVLGQPLIYNIVIRNMGETAAQDVVVEDRIPKGTELSGTIPRAELVDKTLVWKLGTMQPGEEKKIAVRVTPISEGTIGSIATVNFVAEVGAKTVITAPRLELEVAAPAQVKTGEAVPFVFKLKNAGSSDARGVIVRDIVPEGLRHPDGNDLEYEVGMLPAGQSREIKLTLTAVKAGQALNRVVASAEGGMSTEKAARVDILGPALSVSRTGPKKSFLGRPAQYTTTIANDSERSVDGATVVETVPAGFELLEANPPGHYNPDTRALSWRIDRLTSGQKVELAVKFQAKTAGTKASRVRVIEGASLSSEVASETEIVGAANLATDVSTGGGPLGVGDKATFRVLVKNRGTDAAVNVRLKLDLPAEVDFVPGDNRASASADGREVTLPTIARLEPGRDASFSVGLKAVRSGDVRLVLHTEADDLNRPISREEQIVILADETAETAAPKRR